MTGVDKSRIVGHRGCGNLAPGSTMAAFEKAAEIGLMWVEFDVRLTADGHLVIANKDDLFDVSGENVEVSQSTLRDLQGINVAQNFPGAQKVHTIPMFEDVMQFCINHGIRTQIELKVKPSQEAALAMAVVDTLGQDRFSFPEGKEPLITSFSQEALLAVKQFSQGTLPTGLLIHPHLIEQWQAAAMRVQPDYIHIFGGLNTGDKTPLIHRYGKDVIAQGYHLNAFHVDTPEHARLAIEAGAERFTSNEPKLLMEVT